MAVSTRTVVVYSCDGCKVNKTAPTTSPEDRPDGIYGTVEVAGPGTGIGWFAHTARCVAKAVDAVLTAPREVPDQQGDKPIDGGSAPAGAPPR